jgi:hypothetical protein
VWKSAIYDHYDVSLRRDHDQDGDPLELVFVFTCRQYPDTHTHTRGRGKTSEGTSNLQLGVSQCQKRQGTPPKPTGTTLVVPPYSEAAHRALIALRCAKHHRSFNSVLDDDYQVEVEMLRPGTRLPHPSTVSRDLNAMYTMMSIFVRNYFLVCFNILYSHLFTENYRH